MLQKFILFSALTFSPLLLADSYDLKPWQLSPTLSYETNSLGNFTNVGLKWGAHSHRDQYVELISNLSMFQPANQFSADTSFTNLDVAVRFGVFSQINLYAELGVALDELFVDGRSGYYDDDYDDGYYGDHYYDDDYHDSSRPDWFVGVGAGWRLDWLSVNLYGRYRYLESLEEQFLQHNFDPHQKIPDRYQWFTGLELSVHF